MIDSTNSPTPLPALMSHALHAFVRDYSAAGNNLPSLPALNNLLRVIGPTGVGYKHLGEICILSERVLRVAVNMLEAEGWLTSRPTDGDKTVTLTPEGKRARTRGRRRQSVTERDWERRFGLETLQDLRSALVCIIDQLGVELPHHISSYGQGDPSITGGEYVPAEPGPPRIPGHGQEWPVVVRRPGASAAERPLIALLSQTLAAFTIDYDAGSETVMGGLHGVARFLCSLSDDGMPLGEASRVADVKGTGRAALERHQLVVVRDVADTGPRRRRVFLTELGQRVCERYPRRVVDIEHEWQRRYGAEPVSRVRSTLERIDAQLEAPLPDYPETREWIQRRR